MGYGTLRSHAIALSKSRSETTTSPLHQWPILNAWPQPTFFAERALDERRFGSREFTKRELQTCGSGTNRQLTLF
jgi:hypothetical protein